MDGEIVDAAQGNIHKEAVPNTASFFCVNSCYEVWREDHCPHCRGRLCSRSRLVLLTRLNSDPKYIIVATKLHTQLSTSFFFLNYLDEGMVSNIIEGKECCEQRVIEQYSSIK